MQAVFDILIFFVKSAFGAHFAIHDCDVCDRFKGANESIKVMHRRVQLDLRDEDRKPGRGGAASCAGVTLVEVMVSMALVAIFSTGLYAAIIQASRANYQASQRVAAVGLCRERLEQMRGVPYQNLNSAHFPDETVQLTHLGGTAMLPLMGMRRCTFQTLYAPSRTVVSTEVEWVYAGHTNREVFYSVIFEKEASGSPGLTGDVGGSININPNNSPHNQFSLTLPGGAVITRADLHQNYGGYSGAAERIFVQPKGNGNQNSLTLNGLPFPLENKNTYEITGGVLTVNLWNDNVNPAGKAMGKWWIDVTGTGAQIKVQ